MLILWGCQVFKTGRKLLLNKNYSTIHFPTTDRCCIHSHSFIFANQIFQSSVVLLETQSSEGGLRNTVDSSVFELAHSNPVSPVTPGG